jgi:hypothetical protein
MTTINPNWTTLISDLTAEDRKSVEQYIVVLPKIFRQCQGRLRGYGAGRENVIKLLNEMKIAREMIDKAQNELVKRHKLQNLP